MLLQLQDHHRCDRRPGSRCRLSVPFYPPPPRLRLRLLDCHVLRGICPVYCPSSSLFLFFPFPILFPFILDRKYPVHLLAPFPRRRRVISNSALIPLLRSSPLYLASSRCRGSCGKGMMGVFLWWSWSLVIPPFLPLFFVSCVCLWLRGWRVEELKGWFGAFTTGRRYQSLERKGVCRLCERRVCVCI
ncbi:hypothetical protein M011DRAFT_145299 [Sporormia fimetaria CBS 119925]|uniref:Transmembrane protein n=1 Tax=Sporormia fimetaria CBS 119925 TaxID=1340428 RepID=A0A6A6V615_9PLEO|nr:hypothetical protein M011DRAFT_145299 [Sporormia fimetaria CBS 119925]